MYNGIGLQTARGSGTNGYVQRNLSLVQRSREKVAYKTEEDIQRLDAQLIRKANTEILDHERKRKLEIKCLELQETMEDQGREDERGPSSSCRHDPLSPTDPTPAPSPQPSPQPSQQHTPEPPQQPSPRSTPSLLGKRRRDDEANEVLRQTLYESRRLADLTEARNRQDAAFQQSMLEGMRDVAAAVQASNGQQELLIQNLNLLTLILQKQLEPPAPH